VDQRLLRVVGIFDRSGPGFDCVVALRRSRNLEGGWKVSSGPSFFEKHFTPREIARLWRLSYDKILDLFRHEPGVIVIAEPKRSKRVYRSIRIPASVAERVHRRLLQC
jgi:hypothetical protein